VLVLWTKAIEDGGFSDLFPMFMAALSAHVPTEREKVCRTLRIPRTGNTEHVAILIDRHIYKLMRYPVPLASVWRILANGTDVFVQPVARFWKAIAVQIPVIRFNAKKT